MESKRKISGNNEANVDMILTAVIAGVMFAIAIPIIYSVLGGINYEAVDENLGWNGSAIDKNRPATNASNSLLDNLATFFTIGPIYLVVVAAVGIIAAVLMLRGR